MSLTLSIIFGIYFLGSFIAMAFLLEEASHEPDCNKHDLPAALAFVAFISWIYVVIYIYRTWYSKK